MDGGLKFDYYYGIEAEQFSFYRVPRLLIKDVRFKGLSSDAKLLYGLMLDRMALSMKNGWFDEENRAYIHYTIENVMEDLGCARATCVKVLAELDSKKGIGLIEKKRQGLGKPDIIYVKNFVVAEQDTASQDKEEEQENIDSSTEVQKLNFRKFKKQTSESPENEIPEIQRPDSQKFNNNTCRGSKSELQEIQKTDFQRFKKQTFGSSENELAEVQKPNPNYNNINYTDNSYTNPIYPSSDKQEKEEKQKTGEMDRMDDTETYIQIIRKNIDYEHHMKYNEWQDKALYDELYELICEIVCVKRKTVKVNGEDYPYELVKAKFLKLNSSHLQYVIDSMQNTTTKIGNIRAYMVTALYNAPNTMNHYYQQEVQHDMYGGGWIEKGIG
ncbi:MAG: replication initiator protein A [Lachnospiraceae bacterium]|nr:replication initiator protein A [Lachnospiraceae bacterium]